MTRLGSAHRALGLSLALGAGMGGALVGCSEDGSTPNCPPVRLYDIRALDEDGQAGSAGADPGVETEAQAIERERQAAVDANCMTDIDRTDAGAAP